MHKRNPESANPPRRAVVLAAGRGTRLRPHTDTTPKPLLHIDGRPTLDYILTSLATAGVRQVCLVTGYLAAQIETYVGDGQRWGLQASFVQQSPLLGTAHALQAAAAFLTEPAFVLAADYALAPDHLANLKSAYREAEADLALSLKKLSADEISSRSSVAFDAGGKITRIVEKPAPGTAPSDVGASLIYIVPPQIANYLNRVSLSTRQEYEIVDVINAMLADGFAATGLLQPAPREWQP